LGGGGGGGGGGEWEREIGLHDLISPDGYGKGDIGIVMDEFSGLLRVGIGGEWGGYVKWG
jgi:hypothetical protein